MACCCASGPAACAPATARRATIETYTDTAEHLAAYARDHDHADLDRALIEDYLADLADRWKPGTVAFRYRSLQQFTKWLAAEGELDADPMEGMRAPHCPRSLCRS